MTDPQLRLIDPAQTMPQTCPVGHCQAIRLPGQNRVPTCAHDLDPERRKRPNGCLNTPRPEHTEIPY